MWCIVVLDGPSTIPPASRYERAATRQPSTLYVGDSKVSSSHFYGSMIHETRCSCTALTGKGAAMSPGHLINHSAAHAQVAAFLAPYQRAAALLRAQGIPRSCAGNPFAHNAPWKREVGGGAARPAALHTCHDAALPITRTLLARPQGGRSSSAQLFLPPHAFPACHLQ